MGYKNLINTNINRAFNAAKDLAIDATFVKKNTNEFNFETADLKPSETTQVILKTIVVEAKKNADTDSGHNAKKQQIMLKSKDVGDITLYDHLLINNEVWKIGPVVRDSGFIVIAEIVKEV